MVRIGLSGFRVVGSKAFRILEPCDQTRSDPEQRELHQNLPFEGA